MVDRNRLAQLIKLEEEEFDRLHPTSKQLHKQASNSLLSGVPMHWMVRSAGKFPLFVTEGKGANFVDVDGIKYLDFALGDTGAMTGHSPQPIVTAIQDRIQKGCTFMLPTTDSIWVAEELQRRFSLPYWQFSLTATDANRFCIRIARHLTKRPKILVFNYCYHGTVDETFATLHPITGKQVARAGNIGPPVDLSLTTRVVEFNDIPALERALAEGDVACVLAEPAMTNIGIILPNEGYHKALRELTTKYGAYLIIDETHTICAGVGGYTKEFKLEPDFLVLGKPLGGGIPIATYGFTHEIGNKLTSEIREDESDTGGIGGTMAGNALSLAAAKATLQSILTQSAYDISIPLGNRFHIGIEKIIKKYQLPWIVQSLGCRSEFWFRESPPKNGGEAVASLDSSLDYYFHLGFLNRRILLTPFHNMILISPFTTDSDIDYTIQVFEDLVRLLVQPNPKL